MHMEAQHIQEHREKQAECFDYGSLNIRPSDNKMKLNARIEEKEQNEKTGFIVTRCVCLYYIF